MNSFTTIFDDNIPADLFLKSQGFKRCSNRLSDFAPDKNGKQELVRGQYSRGKETACLFWKKAGWEITVYNEQGIITVPKAKKKRGPKHKKDKKLRMVVFFRKSIVKQLGGEEMLKKIIYNYTDNYAGSGILSPSDLPLKK